MLLGMIVKICQFKKPEAKKRPEAEILAHEVGKYEKVTVDYIPLYACAKLFTRAQQSFCTCETTGFHPYVFFVKRRYFSFRSFYGLQEKKAKPIWETFTVRICINVLQDLSFLLLTRAS